MIRSGRTCFSRRTMSPSFLRSYSKLLGTNGAEQPRPRSALVTKEPRNPAPPVTITRLSVQKPPIRSGPGDGPPVLAAGIAHHAPEFGKANLGRQSENHVP